MKKYIITIIVSLLSFGMASAQKSIDHFQIQVDGLGCPFCAYGLEKKFKEFKGIKQVSIKIDTGDFKFTYPSDKELTMDAIITQVKKAGYTPKSAKIVRANGKEELFNVNVFPLGNEEGTIVTTKSLLVYGNCEMCKHRIEAAALSTDGVKKALWNMDTQTLELDLVKSETSLKKVAKSIALSGHDSKEEIAKSEIYEELPLCCAYRNPNRKIN